jgi:hypothetical protein
MHNMGLHPHYLRARPPRLGPKVAGSLRRVDEEWGPRHHCSVLTTL